MRKLLWSAFALLSLLLVGLLLPIVWLNFHTQGHVLQLTNVDHMRSVAGREMENNLLGYGLAVRRYVDTRLLMDAATARVVQSALDEAYADYRRLVATPRQQEIAEQFSGLWRGVKQQGEGLLANPGLPDASQELSRLHAQVYATEAFLDGVLQPEALMVHTAMRAELMRDISNMGWLALTLLGLGLGATALIGRVLGGRILAGEAALTLSEARFKLVVDAAPNAMLAVARNGRIELANAAALHLFGYAHEELVDQKVEMLLPTRFRAAHPRQREAYAASPSWRLMGTPDLCGLKKDGTEVAIEISLNPVTIPGGPVILASITDVSIRQQHKFALQEMNASLEQRVAQRTVELQRAVRELERSNQTLQEFASIAAHDLQTPLRAIRGFSDILRDAMHARPDAQTAEPLNHIIAAAVRMQALTSDLLAYAKATDLEASSVEVDLEEALEEAVSTLRDALAALGGSLSHDPLPRVRAVRTEMLLLLRNLVSNAIKFHGAAAPHIHVSAQLQGDAWRVTVADNGIGIDPKYQARIFEVFRRLHAQHRYPGTGIGLALVKRIVEQRGGSVGVDSALGGGSRFWFTILKGAGNDSDAGTRQSDGDVAQQE